MNNSFKIDEIISETLRLNNNRLQVRDNIKSHYYNSKNSKHRRGNKGRNNNKKAVWIRR